jgi:hypothetical protein
MVTITRKIKRRRAIPAVRTQLTSLLGRRTRPSEPAEGWFTLQTEPGDATHGETVTVAVLAGGAGDRAPQHASGVGSQNNGPHGRTYTIFHAITLRQRWLIAAIAVIGAMAVAAVVAVSSQGTDDRALIVAQRARITELAAQRNQALVSAREAQSGQGAWRAQAMQWRSRALARTSGSGKRRSINGRRRARRAGRRKVRGSTGRTKPRS